jgi:ATP:ADP antiporter, AAA family
MQKSENDRLVLTAIVSAGAMIAFQVAGKATRDALFLSNFPVTALPGMSAASAALSIAAVLAASRLLSLKSPHIVIPAAFGVSSILLIAEWMIYAMAPKATAILLYLHMAAFGATLVSGFWSQISELFDPRTAKREIGRIVAGGTIGGLLGGIIAERAGAMFSVSVVILALAVLHCICALLNHGLQTPAAILGHVNVAKKPVIHAKSGFQVLRSNSYLLHIALLVLLTTVAEGLLDYVMKANAFGAFTQGQQLIRFFALFYTGTSLITVLIQAPLSRYALQRFGATTTMSTMPFMVAAGGFVSLVWPGLLSIGFGRGMQAVLKDSLFRSGYELLYAPVLPAEKRSAKTIVDVGCDKFGDALAAGIIRLVLFAGLSALISNRLLTVIAVMLGVLSIVLTLRLGKEYVTALEKSLLSRAADLDLMDVEERSTRTTMLRTLGTIDLGAIRHLDPIVVKKPQQRAVEETEAESLVRRILDLQSEDTATVRAALSNQPSLDPFTIAPAIRLLARDDVSEAAVQALRNSVATSVGQLTDALLNSDEDFAVRRRIPRVLAYSLSTRSVEGLMRGLADTRFEVRFSCGRALSRICSLDFSLRPPPALIYAATLDEIAIANRLSDTPRVLDSYDDHSDSDTSHRKWDSTDIRLEHIFRLLSVCLPPEPLHVAFQALHTDDVYLRGTALEYLETIVPAGVRETLILFLDGTVRPQEKRRSADHIAEELMQSRQQIALKVTVARRES